MALKHELGRWKDADGDWFSLPMIPSENGRWVKYSAYAKLESKLKDIIRTYMVADEYEADEKDVKTEVIFNRIMRE